MTDQPSNKPVVIRSDEYQRNYNTEMVLKALEQKSIYGINGVIEFSIHHCVRRILPYGIWTCSSGREVVFNREYQPILQKIDGVCSHTDRNEHVENIVKTEYLYSDANNPMDLLSNKYAQYKLSAAEKRSCHKSLLICLDILGKYSPAEHSSVNSYWSVWRFLAPPTTPTDDRLKITKGSDIELKAKQEYWEVDRSGWIHPVSDKMYRLEMSQYHTHAKVFGILIHLSNKNWVTKEMLVEFAEKVCTHNRLEIIYP